MNWVDIIIATPIIFGTYFGYQKGVLSQIASWFSWILGFYGSGKLSKFVIPFLKRTNVVNSSYLSIVSFFISFLLIFWAVHLSKILLARIMRFTWTYSINKFFGALLGFIKSFLYISVSVFFFNHFNILLGLISSTPLNNSIFFQKIILMNQFLYERILQAILNIKTLLNVL